MIKVRSPEFLEFIKNNELLSWETLYRKVPFFYKVDKNNITFLVSTGNYRPFSTSQLDDVCEIFNNTNSFKTTHYDEFRTKSYLVTILKAYVDFNKQRILPSYFSKLDGDQKYLSRSKIYQLLGTKLKNDRWAWGGLANDESYVVFTIWVDRIQRDKKLILYRPLHEKNRNGAKEQKRLIDIALRKNLPVYGLICDAKDPTLDTRSINRVEQNDLIQMELVEDGEDVWVQLKERFPMSELRNKHRFKNLAVHDLNQDAIGNESPNKNSSVVAFYERDPKVRKEVIQMAKGKCEYCGQEGFLKLDGIRYLEAHHIIALSNQGKDMVTNVIALCPNHHKKAHYGKESEQLENKFIEIVKNRKSS